MGLGQTRTNGTSRGLGLAGCCCCIISLFPHKAANGLKLAGRKEGKGISNGREEKKMSGCCGRRIGIWVGGWTLERGRE
jgi:hypothetical protein